jgi:tRNA threonylcarbamoyladenosine biosynthesis protein TsaE
MNEVLLSSLEDTHLLGIKLGNAAKGSLCAIALKGELGVGKTTICKSIVEGRLSSPIEVQSPTFNLLNLYENEEGKVYHYDLYRLKDQKELMELGLEDALSGNNLVLFEWPKKALSFLNSVPKILVNLSFNGPHRVAQIECKGINLL